jgi:hypothetical protein
MKRVAFALVFTVVCGSIYAQDADPPNPAEYEELKVPSIYDEIGQSQ